MTTEMTAAEILTALCTALRIEGATVVAEGEGARVRFTQPLYPVDDAAEPSTRLFHCAGVCGLYMDPDASAGTMDEEAETRHVDNFWRPTRESATETACRPTTIDGATLVYVDGSRYPLVDAPGVDALWLAAAGVQLSQASTVGVDGYQYTAGRPRGWFGSPRRGWYVGPVYEVREVGSRRPALSEIDPEGDVTARDLARLDAGDFDEAHDDRSYWSTPEAAEARATAVRAEGRTATVARLEDATDPTEALASLGAAAGPG